MKLSSVSHTLPPAAFQLQLLCIVLPSSGMPVSSSTLGAAMG